MKRSKISLPKTAGGSVISLDLTERMVYEAVKKAGKKGLTAGEAEGLLGRRMALTTRLRTIERLRGYGLISAERAVGGSVVYRVITRKPGPKPKPHIGELRCYQCVRHPHYSVRNAAKFVDGVFETDNLETQGLLEGLSDFGVLIVRISPEEAQAARRTARAERDRVVESCTVRS